MLVAYAFYNAVLHGMAKRAVAYVVQQYGYAEGIFFIITDFDSFRAQHAYGFLHKVHTPQRMVKACVVCPGVHKIGQPHLRYAAQALKIRVLY